MADRDRERDRERLFAALWPTPEPPRDLAERVLAAMEEEGVPVSGRATTRGRATLVGRSKARPPGEAELEAQVLALVAAGTRAEARRRRVRWLAGSGGLAAAVAGIALVAWWAVRSLGDLELEDARGHLVASARTTVNIAERAAAAMEPGADLTWAVLRKRVRVDQRRGSVFYRVDRGGDPFRVSTPAGDVEVTGTCFRVTLGAAGTLAASTTVVSVLEGSVKVSSGGRAAPLVVQAGETVRLQSGQPPHRVPGASGDGAAAHEQQLRDERLRALEQQLAEQNPAREPEILPPRPGALVLPAATGLRVHGDRIGHVSLSLPASRGRGGAMAVEVARDPGFRRKVFSGPVRGGQVTVPAPARGDLYWRQPGRTELVGHARFLPDRRRSAFDLRRPHNVVNEGAGSTSVYFQGAPPAITLAFAPSSGASRYRTRIYRAADPQRPIFERVVSGPRSLVKPGTLTEGHYLWSVQPLDGQGAELGSGASPRLNKLDLFYDNALDTLAISRPLPEQKVSGRVVEIQGVAPLQARLFVNGTPAPLDDKGRFSLKLPGRPRTLVFRLLPKTGPESYWVRPLKGRSRS